MADDKPTQEIFLPGLAKLVALVAGQQDMRVLQSDNAPQLVAETQGTLTDAATVAITEATSRNVHYSFLVVAFDETAGKGRYSWLGKQTAAGAGFPIPSGGGTLTVFGAQNIANFRMIAETGQTLPYTYGLFL